MSNYPTKWSLPALGVNPDLVVSCGTSSGGYTSSQLQVVYSDRIKGAGIIIGGPYMSGSVLWRMKALSWKDEDYEDNHNKIDMLYDEFMGKTLEFEKNGKIDSLKNIKDSPVYAHLGANDLICRREMMDLHKNFYGGLDANFFGELQPGMGHEHP
jgi:hypothetical protein